jgi:glycosyltransferase involved in cell wall biosynthesis
MVNGQPVGQAPLVSIGMPVYNEAKWIRQALDALLAQTLRDFELLISDNASTDGTWEILQRYAAQDSRIALHRQPENRGAIVNFQFVLDQAYGKYFIWAGGHDLWSPNLLEVLAGDLQACPSAVLCVPRSAWITEGNEPLDSFTNNVNAIDTRAERSSAGRVLAMYQQMERCNALYGLYRRQVLLQAMPWPRVLGSDFIVLVRIAELGDIINNPAARWFRRQNRLETHSERIQRHVNFLRLKGLAARFPYWAGRLAIMAEFSKASGSYRDKAALLGYGLRRLFLKRAQLRLLLRELLSGLKP